MLKALLFAGLICLHAHAEFQVPAQTGPVVDGGAMLSPDLKNRLSEFLHDLKDKGGSEIQVVTVNDLGGASIEEAGIRLADAWKLGNAKEDNGVILLVAKTERRVRIEVGQGREGVLPDIVASRIIREVITPRFKQGQIDQGVRDGVLAIVHYTDPEFLKDGPAAANQKSGGGLLKLIILILFFTFMFVGPFFGRRGRRGMFGGGSSWGGSSWGGGGGGFSGGGASGSW